MFSKAIVKTPCRAMTNGITTADLGIPQFEVALEQHLDYIQALKDCGLEVLILDADENYPDSTFVEDVALLTPHCAILTNPGASTRRNETLSMLPILKQFYASVDLITAPGTVEAGDIMMVESHYYIGLSQRTNHQGAEQLISILEKNNMTGSIVTLEEVLHLKTGLGYLEGNNLLACGEFLTKPEFQKFNLMSVNEKESYAANSVWINGTVLVPFGFPKTKYLIEGKGYKVRTVDVSEFQKLDGGLSCLSLRF
ncbi:MAG: N(G),N(G)-dimethylarginine dimethylaminohydrolase [Gammaproteobacteria bacterium]|nr:MAG: N(G),N(G)-dimethylarginine dimethylaminohydrolase [Gammaproteobacteria bacterium]